MPPTTTAASAWWRVGAVLLIGLFVAYIDRTNLSVALPQLSKDMGFAGDAFAATNSLALTTFLIGYAFANVLGGFLTLRIDPKKVVTTCFLIWSIATIIVGFTSSVYVLLACRLILGVAEGIYWPQMSRFARGWFAPKDLTKANSIIQYYGQFLALAIGFLSLTPINDAYGWRTLFFVTGALGILIIVPLFLVFLRPEKQAPFQSSLLDAEKSSLSLAAFGGPAFLLMVFSYVTQGMLFWGITLWIPLAVKSLGFSGVSQALASALPYLAAVVFAIPLSMLSDRTGKRVLIAAIGLIGPGILLLALPLVDSGYAKLAIITIALGYYAGSYTPNIWSILQQTVEPRAIGPAAGIMNGIGAGGGGTIAGFLVGYLKGPSDSFVSGFMALGGLVVLGGIALLIYGQVAKPRDPALQPAQ